MHATGEFGYAVVYVTKVGAKTTLTTIQTVIFPISQNPMQMLASNANRKTKHANPKTRVTDANIDTGHMAVKPKASAATRGV
jgi:hypothetical protein